MRNSPACHAPHSPPRTGGLWSQATLTGSPGREGANATTQAAAGWSGTGGFDRIEVAASPIGQPAGPRYTSHLQSCTTRRRRLAGRKRLANAERPRRRQADPCRLPAGRLYRPRVQRRMRRDVPTPQEPLSSARHARPDAVPGMGRRLDVAAERLRSHGRKCRRRGGRRRLRAGASSPTGREGVGPQLPGHVLRPRFPARLDAAHGDGDAARRLRAGRLRRQPDPASGGIGGRRRDMGAGLQGGGRCGTLCAGRRVHDRGRRRPRAERRLRPLLQGLRDRGG